MYSSVHIRDVYVNQMSLMIEQALEIEQLNLKDSSVLTNNVCSAVYVVFIIIKYIASL